MAGVNGKKLALGFVAGVSCILIVGGMVTMVKLALGSATPDSMIAATIEGSAGPAAGEEVPADPSTAACDFKDWVGQTAEDAEQAAKDAKRPYRLIAPGAAVTMDFRANRINIELNDKNIVTKVTCG